MSCNCDSGLLCFALWICCSDIYIYIYIKHIINNNRKINQILKGSFLKKLVTNNKQNITKKLGENSTYECLKELEENTIIQSKDTVAV